jgi:two-component system OmpR family response regulator
VEVDRVLGGSPEAVSDAPVSDQPHVLVVDDDKISQRIARALLEKQGFKVSEASDGVEAMQNVFGDGATYDLIILDLDMPRMDGRSVMSELKSSDATARIPVVVLTGATSETAETELIEQGADDYVRKPIDPTRFTARVKAVLRRARS